MGHPYSLINNVRHFAMKSSQQVKKGDLEWDILAEKNIFDIQLYDYIVQLFDEQKDIINTYYTSVNSNTAAVATATTSWDWDA